MRLKTLKQLAAFAAAVTLSATAAVAQVTTGGMSGVVRDEAGEPMAGATVTAKHMPSGSGYYAVASTNGNYIMQGMRVGGPYTVEVAVMGYQPESIENVYISLGESVNINVVLKAGAMEMAAVVISADRLSALNKKRTGAVTNISSREMTSLPTINRNITDAAKLSPYSTGGSSFGGREAYMTNITVDGANFNNNFGLSSNAMPGVVGEPISMDAIEEMQVVVAPFDVRQSNFTSAGVNAVTKSGTNEVKGTIYGYYRNQDFGGTKMRDIDYKDRIAKSNKQTLGFSAGGPILRDKLFFFINGEVDNTLRPGNTLRASETGIASDDPDVSNSVLGSDLQAFSDFLKQKFDYNTGAYQDWGGDKEYNNKLLARLDWNAHKDHKVTLRYNYSQSSSVSRPSSSGDANPSINTSRHGKTGGMSFENSQYFNKAMLHSVTGELHSRLSNRLSNHLLVAYTKLDQPRSSNSSLFPFVDIMRGGEGDRNPLMSAGYELFSYNNRVRNNTLIVTNNLSFQLNKHVITGGISFEHQYFANSYLRQGTGYYRYKNLEAFKNHANGVNSPDGLWNSDYHPLNFAYTYPINGYTDPVAELSFGQFSAYGQDEWSALDNLKLTAGLRIDLPVYLDGAVDNPLTHGLAFRDGETVDLGSWPKARLLWSPRLGFNWDVHKDRSLTLRGGTGIFTGRIPFVWFTNQPTNSGMLQYQLVINQNGGNAAKAQLARLPFATDAGTLLQNSALADIFPQSNAPGRLAVIDKNFKLPQVWRTSVAADIKLPHGMVLTLEGIYSKDINAIAFDNINLQNSDGKIKEGSLERDYYTTGAQRYLANSFTDVIVMRNTGEGRSYSLSAQLKLPNWNGLSGDIAYTYSNAKEITGKNGSDPYSAWRYRQALNTLNAAELGFTMNNTPHRLLVSASYHVDYARFMGSTFTLLYNGYTGASYSYTYSTYTDPVTRVVYSPNNDGGVGTYLAYLPKEKSDVIWASDADWDAYKWFVTNDEYLKNHLGEHAKRYDAHLPWNTRLDFRFTQDFKLKVGKTTNTLQFTADILNVANLIDSNWGINKELNGSNKAFQLLRFEGMDAATGKAKVSMTKSGGAYQTSAFRDPNVNNATWMMQLGLRYIFG